MLSLFRKRAAPEPAPPRTVPAGRRVYAVGDIHGRLDLLDDLIARIDADDAARDAGRTDWVRSEERRVGKEWVSTCRSRWSPYHETKKQDNDIYTQLHITTRVQTILQINQAR